MDSLTFIQKTIESLAWPIGTLIEEVLTAGAGVTDDAPSFALAAGMFARGWAMINNARLPLVVTGAATAAPALADDK